MTNKRFTLAEANAALPWLESVLRQVAPLRRELAEVQTALDALSLKAGRNGHTSTEGEVFEAQKRAAELSRRIDELLKQVSDRGIILRDADRGLVDFPSMREGREVFLCWLWGEEAIGYWHETDTGFSGRKPL